MSKNSQVINIKLIEAEESLDYVNEYIDKYVNAELDIVCAELKNGEKILCLYDFDDPQILYLPIHLIENIEHDEHMYKVSYLLYPYQFFYLMILYNYHLHQILLHDLQ